MILDITKPKIFPEREKNKNPDSARINPTFIESQAFTERSLTYGYIFIFAFMIAIGLFFYLPANQQYTARPAIQTGTSSENGTAALIKEAQHDKSLIKADFKGDGWLILTVSDDMVNPQRESQKYIDMAKAYQAVDIIAVKVIDANEKTLGVAFY